MSELWYPSNYTARFSQYAAPKFGDTPPDPLIPVVDIAAKQLPFRRRRFWRRVRAAALQQWKDCGFSLPVVEALPVLGYQPGKITLDIRFTSDGTNGFGFHGVLPDNVSGGHDVVCPEMGFAQVKDSFFETYFKAHLYSVPIRVLAHEIGHALAFGHGGDGLMQSTGGIKVNLEESTAVRAYWLT